MEASLKFTEKTENEAATKCTWFPSSHLRPLILLNLTMSKQEPEFPLLTVEQRTIFATNERLHDGQISIEVLQLSKCFLELFRGNFPKTCSCYHLSWWDRQAKRTKLVPFNPNLRFSHDTYSPAYQYFLKPVPMPWGLSWFERETSSIGSYIWRFDLQ